MVTTMTMQGRRGLTRADLEDTSDDGWRDELLDGMLLVSPAPSTRHQRVSHHLDLILGRRARPTSGS